MTSLSRIDRYAWYARRLGRMTPGEVAWRVRDGALQRAWTRRQVRPGEIPGGTDDLPVLARAARRFASVLPPGTGDLVPSAARAEVIAAADRILKGEWDMLGVVRTDMDAPDWFYDPVTGRRSDASRYAFGLNHRSETEVGNVKQVWELSRLQHLTLLAAAWYLTGSDVYAVRVDEQLRHWWAANPFLSGVHWTSGIEVGVRLINFAWIRRLLSSWPSVEGLFEDCGLFLRQLRWHQEYLAAFVSRGSSANNHVIAEAAGQLAAACAFPWFTESARWRRSSASLLARSLAANTYPSGINRELATDYHGFVFELGVYAALEASAFGEPVSDGTWRLLCSMADCMAALVDSAGQPPRQGDSDEGRVVLLDAPAHNRWPELLSVGSALFGPLDWWPGVPAAPGASGASGVSGAGSGVASVLAGALAGSRREVTGRPGQRPSRFADAGITLLRTAPGEQASGEQPEIWVRCDGGPHGFGSLAAHAHADALSVEVRYGGVDIFAEPGTYCYHGEPEWRSYFRSTLGHNTAEIGGVSQSADGGPFMWVRHARATEAGVPDGVPGGAAAQEWTASHDGYLSLRQPARHRRTARLDESARTVEITDVITEDRPGGGESPGWDVRLAFHLGPDVTADLSGASAVLTWPSGSASLALPAGLAWSAHRGQTDPILGWYSPGLGSRVPAVTLLGTGRPALGQPLITRLTFDEHG